jgi:hypothetical protein
MGAMVDVLSSEVSEKYPYLGKRKDCITLCIFPNRWCANGVPYHAISFKDLHVFKRIAAKKFVVLCPDFGQLRHKGDTTLDYLKTCSRFINIPKRKETFGI